MTGCRDARPAAPVGGPIRGLARRGVDAVRLARWITADRLVLWATLFGAFFAVAFVYTCLEWTATGLRSASGNTLGDDFVLFWSGAHLAAAGDAAAAYDPPTFQAYGEAVVGGFGTYRIYVYPPVALLLSSPLALLPFVPGLICWLAAGAGLFVTLLRRLVGWRLAIVALFAAPASFMNFETGQNGFYTAALFAGGLMALDRRPIIAGACFGCLVFKPQLAVLLPFALAAGGYWRAFAAAAATVALLVAASVLLYGTATWEAFFAHAYLQTNILEYYRVYWHRMVGLFTLARLLGASIPIAFSVQLVSSLVALALVVRVWRSSVSAELKAAALVIATFLATPHLWEYDEAVILFAAAWLAREGRRSGFLGWERMSVLALIVLPAIRTQIGLIGGVPLVAFVLWPILAALIWRRCGRSAAGDRAPARPALAAFPATLPGGVAGKVLR